MICVKEVELKNILDNINSYYYEKTFAKYKNGKRKLNKEGTPRDRIINPCTKELPAIQKRINTYLAENIAPANYSYGGVKKRDNVKNAAYHKGNKFFFQTDLQDFFPFITCKKVYSTLVSHKFSPDVASRITRLTTYKGHLPQGASTSSSIANLVFAYFAGDKIFQYAKENGLRLTMFVDDVTLSSPVDFKDKTQAILQIIRECDFKISHSKTHYGTYPSNITGVKMSQNTLNVTDAFQSKLNNPKDKSAAQIKGEILYKKKVLDSNVNKL